MSTDFAIIRDEAELLEMRDEWNALWARCAPHSPFMHFDWVWLTWQRRRKSRPKSLYVAVIRDDGRLVAALPLMITLNLLVRYSLNVLEGPLPSDPDVLIEPRPDSAELARLLLRGLAADRRILRLRLGLAYGAAPVVEAAREQQGLKSLRDRPATIADFSSGFDAYWAARSNGLRVTHRRNIRRLQRRGTITYTRSDAATLDADLSWLLEQKRNWTPPNGKRRPWLRSPEAESDLRAICRLWLDRGWTWMTTLRVDGVPAAANLAFAPDSFAADYILTYDPAFAYYSPGLTSTLMLMEQLAEAGVTAFSLMGGEYDWKTRVVTRTVPLYAIRFFA